MPKQKILAAIDVGTTKVCTIVATQDSSGGLQVLGVGVTPSRGRHKVMVVNVNEAKESIRESVMRAQQSSGTRIYSAYVGGTGRHIVSRNSKGVIAIPRNDRLVRPDDLKRVLDSARNVVVPSDRRILHAIPRQHGPGGRRRGSPSARREGDWRGSGRHGRRHVRHLRVQGRQHLPLLRPARSRLPG